MNECSSPSESLKQLLLLTKYNKVINNSFIKTFSIINNPKYKKIACFISGGSDSDIVMDLIYRCDYYKKVDYIYIDTGLEYQATKNHLKYLSDKYNTEIKIYRAKKPIPTCCREYGQPFISKQVSEFIERLQKHKFTWIDKPFDVLSKTFLKCKSALEWWCESKGSGSMFNISRNKYLKEFMIDNPPRAKFSNKCCKYSKKDTIHMCLKENDYDLNIFGVRKSEGGARASAYKSCFDTNGNGYDNYRPIIWYKDSDKKVYEDIFLIKHSRCYTEYGLKRTGCAGCPFGKDFEYELEIIKKYEPKLYKAVNNIFRDSYDYTRKYLKYRKDIDNGVS